MAPPVRPSRSRREPSPARAPVSLGAAGATLAAPGASNQSALQRFAPQLPRLSAADLRAILAESERPVRAWLDANESLVATLSLAAATAEVLRRVPGAGDQGAGMIAGIVRDWAAERGLTLRPVSLVPHPADAAAGPGARPSISTGDSGLIAAVRGAIGAVTEGIRIERPYGFTRIGVSGATVGLRPGESEISGTVTPSGGVRVRAGERGGRGEVEVSESGVAIAARPPGPGVRFKAGVSWSGALNFSSSIANFHFAMSVTPERWPMTFTFPSGDMPADLSMLGRVFGDGESALRAALIETAGVRNLGEIPDLADRLSPHIDPIRTTIRTVTRVARTQPGVSFGVRLEGRGARPGEAGGAPSPQATTLQGVLTIVF